ncbi:RcpC/CpaB family pilus assembly protein [Alkalihalobacillus macyae]|uniref:RcpC/CpaB family pilus assembly protein n=1 Tax=Guptibacillus hwajinpoensis TaxID=208199 RepID=UPI00273CF29F|nr:RcpC/CpaB family pilus assembly protein [Alkalihalobacillus macyae]MDP4552829.1 RcpC/CpaB family pilus assembly protein [Alkalihalobacillus macyae]
MNTKRIWMWSLIFGVFATLIVYVGLFTNLTAVSTDSTEVKEAEKKEVLTEAEETIAGREMANPIVEVSEGNRAISINVDLAGGVSGYIEPNSYVDVVAYERSIDEEGDKEYKSAVLVLQNKKVLTSGKAPDSVDEALHYETVTLEVTPEEGVLLSLAAKDESGFYLMLRNKEDDGVSKKALKETRQVYKESN